MIEVGRSRDVSAPPSAVWAVLADFAAISSWAADVDHSCLMSDQTEGVGMVRRIQTGRTTVVERVVTWGPPTCLSYALTGLPPAVRSATNTWTVTATPSGSRVSLTSRVDARPRLVARAVGHKLGQASDRLIVGLQARVS